MPGDKSISHRALIFGALAQGQTGVDGLLESEDVMHTLKAMRALGAKIEKQGQNGKWQIDGLGIKKAITPESALDFGNAGTGVRLSMGLVAGLGITARFIGDQSLSRRPMGRILEPLKRLGVIVASQDGCLPVTIRGIAHFPAHRTEINIASAQVKSALLLAALRADGVTEIIEPAMSRDHSERMLSAFGADITSTMLEDGRHRVVLNGPAKMQACSINVPGDPSSAAFPITAALCIPGSDITLQGMLMNPTRTGFIETARRMGGRIKMLNARESGGEPIADLRIYGSSLKGITTDPSMAPSMIDEFPVLAVLAAFAHGPTMMCGIGELRVKESDRIARTIDMLESMGVPVQCGDDWMRIEGTGAVWGDSARTTAVPVRTDGDHRIAMAALVLGLAAFRKIQISEPECIATSYPDFYQDMCALGARFQTEVNASC